MPGQFTSIATAEAQAQLRVRLYDIGVHRFWNDAELAAHLREAIRVWQALTCSWFKRTDPLPLSSDRTAMYDLHLTGDLPFDVTDLNISYEILQHLLEYDTRGSLVDPLVWNGTGQFNWEVILQAVNRRVNQFLFETGASIRRLPRVPVPSSPIGRLDIPQNVIDVRRVVWMGASDAPIPIVVLARETEHSADSFAPDWWDHPAVPSAFSMAATPGQSLQLIPPPSVAGELDMYVVQANRTLNNTGQIVEVPTDFCWAVKWGALSDLLQGSGRACDPIRAQHAELLYKLGVQAATLNPSVKSARINDVPVSLDNVHDLDFFRPGWQLDDPGTPYSLCLLGRNMIAPYPVPAGFQQWSLTMDLIVNAPVNELYLQVGQETLDAILDYAQHIAMWKVGGQEFLLSIPLRDNFIRLAATQNGKIAGLLDKLYMEQAGRNYDRLNPVRLQAVK